MTRNTQGHSQPPDPGMRECDDCTHYNKDGTEELPPQGRLVLVLEHELSDASRKSLHGILQHVMSHEDVTMISGLSRASMLQAEQLGNGLFYNRKEYLPPEKAFRMLPWREVWVVSGGRVWTLFPSGPL